MNILCYCINLEPKDFKQQGKYAYNTFHIPNLESGTKLTELRHEVARTIRLGKFPNCIARHRINLFSTL